jgi:putative ABC transport system permease protein
MPSSSFRFPRLTGDGTARDLRQSWRVLRRRPGFLAIAVVSLGLAIALNTVMYSVLDALLNPVVDVRGPDRLFALRYFGKTRGLDRGALRSALRSGRHTYEDVSGYSDAPESLVEHERRLQQVVTILVRPDFLVLLGVRPIAGRVLVPSDANSPTCTVVISDRLAGQLFARHDNPVGGEVRVDDRECTVVGVVPKYVNFPALDADLWRLPSPRQAALPINMIRLRPGADPRQVENELGVLADRLAVQAGERASTTRFDLKPWMKRQFRVSNFHYALIAAVLAVLLVACANLANLQLARGIGRSRELATRAALGAARSRLIEHLLAETILVAGAGLLLGVLLTFVGIHVLTASIPETIADYMVAPRTSWGMFAFATGVALTCIVLVGVAPAMRVSRVDPNELLKSGAGTGAHKRNTRLYGWLIVGEIGLTLALLCGAVGLLRGAWLLSDRRYLTEALYGFDPTPMIGITLTQQAVPKANVSLADAAAGVVARIRAVPGVADATIRTGAPPEDRTVTVIDATGFPKEAPAPNWAVSVVSSSYFSTMGLPVTSGRGFIEGELDSRAVVVDAATAKFLWPKANPIGQMIKFGDGASRVPWSRVVGVVGDRYDREQYAADAVADWPHLGSVYRAVSIEDSIGANADGSYMTRAFVRSSTDAGRLAIELRHALTPIALDGRLGVETFLDGDHITLRRTRSAFVASLFIVFASIAVALAAIGVYGLVAHSVAERRREIGVRIALGATQRDILRALLREGNVLVLAGVAVGLWLTMKTVVWLGMFMVDAHDAVLFGSLAATLFVIVVVAALIPGLRATRIDPVEALRPE